MLVEVVGFGNEDCDEENPASLRDDNSGHGSPGTGFRITLF